MALEELQNGRYRYVRLLGSGGMGEVYLMNDSRVSRQVAIKVIRSESSSYPGSDATKDAARLFQREAKAIAALDHPNILPLYDFGEETFNDITMSYMVMPFSPEGSLTSWLHQSSTATLSPQELTHLVEQAADALQYAHDHQVIHLDVKPSNFLLRGNRKNPNRPTLLLADFGIARSSATASSSSRTIRGTPTAMAPEQWSSTPTFASDQYALAVMVYELLAGRPPFVGGMEQLMYQHFSTQATPPSTFNPQVPPEIDAVMLRALAKKPEDRYPSISAFAMAFEQAALPLPGDLVLRPKQANDAVATSNIRSTLAISSAEAKAGTSRVITLPGGLSMQVTVPPGAFNGQVLSLHNLGDSTAPVGELILTIAIAPSEATPSSPGTISDAPTLFTPQRGVQSQTPVQPVGQIQLSSGHDLPTVASSHPLLGVAEREQVTPPPAKRRRNPLVLILSIVSVLIILVLLAGGIYFYNNYNNSRVVSASALASQTATALAQTPTPKPTTAATPSPTPPPPGQFISGTYNGSMSDGTTSQVSRVSVLIAQTQGSGALSGTFTFTSPSQGAYPLKGVIDMQGNFSFTVQQPAGKQPLYFYGKTQAGDYLHGSYCASNTNSCNVNPGFFTIGPRF